MKIGIIGAGYVGREVGKKAVAAGHQVMLSNSRGPQTLFSLKVGVGCETGTVEEAIAFGDVVIIAMPFPAYATLDPALLSGKIVFDAANYYHERDGHIAALDNKETTTSEIIATHLPGARIVKALNAIRMIDLETHGKPKGAADRVALPIAGDDAEAKALVAELQEQFGFDSVDVGALAEGWRFERDRPAYCTLLNTAELKKALAETQR